MDDDLNVFGIMGICILVLLILGYFLIYNPFIKVRDGCWSWERETIEKNYTLYDYNYTCDKIRDMLLIELYPDLVLQTKDVYCKENLIYETNVSYVEFDFREDFKKECL